MNNRRDDGWKTVRHKDTKKRQLEKGKSTQSTTTSSSCASSTDGLKVRHGKKCINESNTCSLGDTRYVDPYDSATSTRSTGSQFSQRCGLEVPQHEAGKGPRQQEKHPFVLLPSVAAAIAAMSNVNYRTNPEGHYTADTSNKSQKINKNFKNTVTAFTRQEITTMRHDIDLLLRDVTMSAPAPQTTTIIGDDNGNTSFGCNSKASDEVAEESKDAYHNLCASGLAVYLGYMPPVSESALELIHNKKTNKNGNDNVHDILGVSPESAAVAHKQNTSVMERLLSNQVELLTMAQQCYDDEDIDYCVKEESEVTTSSNSSRARDGSKDEVAYWSDDGGTEDKTYDNNMLVIKRSACGSQSGSGGDDTNRRSNYMKCTTLSLGHIPRTAHVPPPPADALPIQFRLDFIRFLGKEGIAKQMQMITKLSTEVSRCNSLHPSLGIPCNNASLETLNALLNSLYITLNSMRFVAAYLFIWGAVRRVRHQYTYSRRDVESASVNAQQQGNNETRRSELSLLDAALGPLGRHFAFGNLTGRFDADAIMQSFLAADNTVASTAISPVKDLLTVNSTTNIASLLVGSLISPCVRSSCYYYEDYDSSVGVCDGVEISTSSTSDNGINRNAQHRIPSTYKAHYHFVSDEYYPLTYFDNDPDATASCGSRQRQHEVLMRRKITIVSTMLRHNALLLLYSFHVYSNTNPTGPGVMQVSNISTASDVLWNHLGALFPNIPLTDLLVPPSASSLTSSFTRRRHPLFSPLLQDYDYHNRSLAATLVMLFCQCYHQRMIMAMEAPRQLAEYWVKHGVTIRRAQQIGAMAKLQRYINHSLNRTVVTSNDDTLPLLTSLETSSSAMSTNISSLSGLLGQVVYSIHEAFEIALVLTDVGVQISTEGAPSSQAWTKKVNITCRLMSALRSILLHHLSVIVGVTSYQQCPATAERIVAMLNRTTHFIPTQPPIPQISAQYADPDNNMYINEFPIRGAHEILLSSLTAVTPLTTTTSSHSAYFAPPERISALLLLHAVVKTKSLAKRLTANTSPKMIIPTSIINIVIASTRHCDTPLLSGGPPRPPAINAPVKLSTKGFVDSNERTWCLLQAALLNSNNTVLPSDSGKLLTLLARLYPWTWRRLILRNVQDGADRGDLPRSFLVLLRDTVRECAETRLLKRGGEYHHNHNDPQVISMGRIHQRQQPETIKNGNKNLLSKETSPSPPREALKQLVLTSPSALIAAVEGLRGLVAFMGSAWSGYSVVLYPEETAGAGVGVGMVLTNDNGALDVSEDNDSNTTIAATIIGEDADITPTEESVAKTTTVVGSFHTSDCRTNISTRVLSVGGLGTIGSTPLGSRTAIIIGTNTHDDKMSKYYDQVENPFESRVWKAKSSVSFDEVPVAAASRVVSIHTKSSSSGSDNDTKQKESTPRNGLTNNNIPNSITQRLPLYGLGFPKATILSNASGAYATDQEKMHALTVIVLPTLLPIKYGTHVRAHASLVAAVPGSYIEYPSPLRAMCIRFLAHLSSDFLTMPDKDLFRGVRAANAAFSALSTDPSTLPTTLTLNQRDDIVRFVLFNEDGSGRHCGGCWPHFHEDVCVRAEVFHTMAGWISSGSLAIAAQQAISTSEDITDNVHSILTIRYNSRTVFQHICDHLIKAISDDDCIIRNRAVMTLAVAVKGVMTTAYIATTPPQAEGETNDATAVDVAYSSLLLPQNSDMLTLLITAVSHCIEHHAMFHYTSFHKNDNSGGGVSLSGGLLLVPTATIVNNSLEPSHISKHNKNLQQQQFPNVNTAMEGYNIFASPLSTQQSALVSNNTTMYQLLDTVVTTSVVPFLSTAMASLLRLLPGEHLYTEASHGNTMPGEENKEALAQVLHCTIANTSGATAALALHQQNRHLLQQQQLLKKQFASTDYAVNTTLLSVSNNNGWNGVVPFIMSTVINVMMNPFRRKLCDAPEGNTNKGVYNINSSVVILSYCSKYVSLYPPINISVTQCATLDSRDRVCACTAAATVLQRAELYSIDPAMYRKTVIALLVVATRDEAFRARLRAVTALGEVPASVWVPLKQVPDDDEDVELAVKLNFRTAKSPTTIINQQQQQKRFDFFASPTFVVSSLKAAAADVEIKTGTFEQYKDADALLKEIKRVVKRIKM